MSAARPASDQAARVRAATDTTVNLVVSAGAGTGKTSLLVERVLDAIGAGVAPLPAIAAITFTDKAAGELRHQLAAGLDELRLLARGEAQTTERTPAARAFAYLRDRGESAGAIEARVTEAIDGLDRAAISTIHGFCSELLRAHPLQARVPPGFSADRGAAARRLADGPWTEFIVAELGPGGARRELWVRVLDTIGLADAQAIALALAAGAVPDDLIAKGAPPIDLSAALGATASRMADRLRDALATPGLTAAPRSWLEEAERALRAFAAGGIEAGRRVIDASERIPGAMPGVRTKKVAGDDAERLEALEECVAPLLRGLATLDERRAADAIAALLPFVARLRERFLRAGLLDFDALLVRARDLLRDVPEVRREVKARFRMILVDEFQDTDPLQYEIVFFAAEADGDEARDAFAARLAPGRLFIVGDAKQSIYRFRGADYAAYRRAVGRVLDQGGLELPLTTNFRSTAAVLEPINALFAPPTSPSWSPSDYLPAYEPIVAHREDETGAPAVEVWTANVGAGANAAERRRVEGQAIAAELARVAGDGKAFANSDVLVLLRGFREIAPYLRALREAGVPFVVSGGRTFFERTEIVQTMAVLRAIADPEDQVALLAYLRSPAGGVDDCELAAHAGAGGAWSLDARVDARGCPLLATALERLRALGAQVRGRPVDEAVRRVVRASGMLPLSGLAFEAAQRVANLEKLMLAASALARDGRLTLSQTLDAIEESFEADEEGDSPLADETTDAVRVMTIHKAKGLEARLVVLADAAAGQVSNRTPDRWSAKPSTFPAGTFLRLDGPSLRNGASLAASHEDGPHERGERVRLLYVALTRARDRLIVFGGGTRSTPWIQALSAWGYDPKSPPADGEAIGGGAVLHRLVSAPLRPRRPAAPPPTGAPEAVSRYEQAVAAVTELAAPAFRSPSRFEDGSAAGWDAGDGALAPDLAREVGIVVHARLAGIPAIARDEEVERKVREVTTAFEASPVAARLASLQVLGREVPVLFDDDAARWRGVIDLIYRDPDGTLVVADYKTDTAVEGAVERHRAQLDVYVRAVQRVFPAAKVRAELWMIRSGEVLEV